VTEPAARPKAPAGLDRAGRSLWRRLTEELEFEPRELAVLEQACRQADAIAALDRVIKDRGIEVRGSKGQPRLNPAVAEARQARMALARLLDTLDLPAEGEDIGAPAASRRAARAARARWGQQMPGQLTVLEGGFGG